MVGVGLPDILMWLMGCVVCEGPMQSLAILLGLLRLVSLESRELSTCRTEHRGA